MSEIKVNKITPKQNCTQVTLGDSGDTFVIPSGVTITNNGTQTGFGRTGTVDWDTTAKTASFTAVSGNGYFVNTTSGAITVTLPASPSAGDIVAVADYAGTAATNNITVARNGSNFQGGTTNALIKTERQTATFVYVDATQGWVPVNSNDQGFEPPLFVTATGGTETEDGDYKIHTFTGPGTFTVTCAGNECGSNTVDYLVVAGGGSGGVGCSGGGGGAGGFRESSGAASGCYTRSPLGACVSALPVTAQGYPVVVGGGAPGYSPFTALPTFPPATKGSSGSNSSFSSITSTGGGGGGGSNTQPGLTGGSGGGAAHSGGTGGSGNTPPVSPPQGNNGANPAPATGPAPSDAGGGGGGASAAGSSTPQSGGNGVSTSISASSTSYAGGGGGTNRCGGAPTCTAGGSGGGGRGGYGSRPTPDPQGSGVNGTANTGGGGGGGKALTAVPTSRPYGGSGGGGSGIVIIRYKFQ